MQTQDPVFNVPFHVKFVNLPTTVLNVKEGTFLIQGFVNPVQHRGVSSATTLTIVLIALRANSRMAAVALPVCIHAQHAIHPYIVYPVF